MGIIDQIYDSILDKLLNSYIDEGEVTTQDNGQPTEGWSGGYGEWHGSINSESVFQSNGIRIVSQRFPFVGFREPVNGMGKFDNQFPIVDAVGVVMDKLTEDKFKTAADNFVYDALFGTTEECSNTSTSTEVGSATGNFVGNLWFGTLTRDMITGHDWCKNVTDEMIFLVNKWGPKYGIPPGLIIAQMGIEGGYKQNPAPNSAGAKGWVQFIKGTWDETAKKLLKNHPNDVSTSDISWSTGGPCVLKYGIMGLCHYMKYIHGIATTKYKLSDEDFYWSLSGYNGGPDTRCKQASSVGGDKEAYKRQAGTENGSYAPKILKRWGQISDNAKKLGLQTGSSSVKKPTSTTKATASSELKRRVGI